jgi:uncharacterized integral membrane protein
MKMLGPLMVLGLVLVGVFSLANWSALSAPTTLSFLIFELDAPLGFVLLGALLVFVALFAVYVLGLRTAMLVDARRYANELAAQRQLAEEAEASRLAALRAQLEREFLKMHEATGRSRADLGVRIDATEQALRAAVEESGRILSAHLGEVEDKLDRSLASKR